MAHVRNQFVQLAAVLAAMCGPVSAGTPSDVASEFPVETEALVAATAAFFDAIEQGPREKNRAPVIRLPEVARKIRSEPRVVGAENLTDHGPVDHLTGYRISWYPMDRILGSVDFMGTWEGNRNLVCGYLTWDMTQPDHPELAGVTANFLSLDDFVGQSPSEVHEALLEANCAFGAIDQNYAFFEPAS